MLGRTYLSSIICIGNCVKLKASYRIDFGISENTKRIITELDYMYGKREDHIIKTHTTHLNIHLLI